MKRNTDSKYPGGSCTSGHSFCLQMPPINQPDRKRGQSNPVVLAETGGLQLLPLSSVSLKVQRPNLIRAGSSSLREEPLAGRRFLPRREPRLL